MFKSPRASLNDWTGVSNSCLGLFENPAILGNSLLFSADHKGFLKLATGYWDTRPDIFGNETGSGNTACALQGPGLTLKLRLEELPDRDVL
jgi:hypothetical protein